MDCPLSQEKTQNVFSENQKKTVVEKKKKSVWGEYLSITVASEMSSRMRTDMKKIGKTQSKSIRSFSVQWKGGTLDGKGQMMAYKEVDAPFQEKRQN